MIYTLLVWLLRYIADKLEKGEWKLNAKQYDTVCEAMNHAEDLTFNLPFYRPDNNS